MILTVLSHNYLISRNGRLSQLLSVGAGGQGFDSQAGQIGRIVANGAPPLRRFFRNGLPKR